MRRSRFLPIITTLLLLLAACTSPPNTAGLPEVELLTDDTGQEYILLDGTRYNRIPSEIIGSNHTGRWNRSAQPGQRVALLGPDSVFTVQGDEEQRFLFNVAESFRFGPVYQHSFLKEGYTLTLPQSATDFDRGTLRTYAQGGILGKGSVITCEFTDEALIAALFDCWNGTTETPPVPDNLDPDKRESRALELWSREYPFLGFYIRCSCWPDGTVTLTDREDTSVCLPGDVAKQLTWEEPGLWQRLTGGWRK
ncbi:MAG: hypothetical protein HFF15_10090 [Angelakisella sp.]|nr:hypothetical protein [Angelakisella sp.]